MDTPVKVIEVKVGEHFSVSDLRPDCAGHTEEHEEHGYPLMKLETDVTLHFDVSFDKLVMESPEEQALMDEAKAHGITRVKGHVRAMCLTTLDAKTYNGEEDYVPDFSGSTLEDYDDFAVEGGMPGIEYLLIDSPFFRQEMKPLIEKAVNELFEKMYDETRGFSIPPWQKFEYLFLDTLEAQGNYNREHYDD